MLNFFDEAFEPVVFYFTSCNLQIVHNLQYLQNYIFIREFYKLLDSPGLVFFIIQEIGPLTLPIIEVLLLFCFVIYHFFFFWFVVGHVIRSNSSLANFI